MRHEEPKTAEGKGAEDANASGSRGPRLSWLGSIPTGASRLAFRLPVYLYRLDLGWMLGHRFLLLVHRGRRSGLLRETVLEVLLHDPVTRESVVLSAWGEKADWYRNVEATSALEVRTGRERYVPEQRFLASQENHAVAVTELEHRERAKTGRREDHWLVRHLERLPLGTPYPGVADRLAVVVEGVKKRTGHAPACYLDATGVGQPVADEMTSRGLAVTACYFTHGDRRTEEGMRVTIGKAWLVSRMQALLQGGRLHLPDTSEARVLADELLEYEIRVGEDANDRYGAFRVGKHDDLVTALGLAVQTESFAVLIGRV